MKNNKDENCSNICNEDFFRCPNSSYPLSVAVIAYLLSQNYDEDCLELLSVLFTQLGDTLDSIITINYLNKKCAKKHNKKTEEEYNRLTPDDIIEHPELINEIPPIFF